MTPKDTTKEVEALSCLLYILMRDHIPVGQLQKVVSEVAEDQSSEPDSVVDIFYSNKHLESMARDMARAVFGKTPAPKGR